MKKLISTLICCTALMSGPSNAALVTLYGDDVSFTFDDASLFGAANIVGNSISFQPTAFRAESENGAGADPATDTLIIDVRATTAGFNMSLFALYEEGDYALNGTHANTSVTASARLGVVSNTTNCGIFACRDSNIINVAGLTDTAGTSADWSLYNEINLADTIGWGSDSSVQLSLQNNLSATTMENGELAWIQKKDGAVGVTVSAIPIPAALWLFGSGLIGLATIARRRKQ